MKHLNYSDFIKSNNKDQVDALFISPHPDDVELFCGGTLAHLSKLGYKTGVIDLTLGEASSRGTVETRWNESKKSSQILDINIRINLNIPDTEVYLSNSTSIIEQRERLTSAIRIFRPEVVFAPFGEDRHPDHQGARKLFDDSLFLSGVASKYKNFPVYHVPSILYYMLRKEFKPDFIVPLTEEIYQLKMNAIKAYNSQVSNSDSQPETLVSNKLSISSIYSRDSYFGSMIGTIYGEPFISKGATPLSDPIKHSRNIGKVTRFIS